MKQLVSTALAVALLLGLGVLAVLARGGGDILTPADNAVAAAAQPQTAAAPAAVPTPAPYMINEIALPLDVKSTFGVANFTAQGLAENIASGKATVRQVSHWNAALEQSDTWDPKFGTGVYNGDPVEEAWPLYTGQAYQLTLVQGASVVYSIVGDVPKQGDINFTWVGGGNCMMNNFSLPLDQDPAVLVDAQALAEAIGVPGVSQISQWNSNRQEADTWDPKFETGVYNGDPTDTAWLVNLGYPYWICVQPSLNGQSWP